MLENLRNELVGKEMSFMELDNYMMNQGFYSTWFDGATEDIKQDKNVAYTSKETDEAEILISFDITIDSSEDEVSEAFEMEITSVYNF